MKIFVNFCEHPDVPAAPVMIGIYNKWPLMLLTSYRSLCDDKPDRKSAGARDSETNGNSSGGEVAVYDAVVHPSVMLLCNKDNNAKDNVRTHRQA